MYLLSTTKHTLKGAKMGPRERGRSVAADCVSLFAFCCCDEHWDQKQLREEKAFQLMLPGQGPSWRVSRRNWDRNHEVAANWISPPYFTLSQDPRTRDNATHSGLGLPLAPPTSVVSQDNLSEMAPAKPGLNDCSSEVPSSRECRVDMKTSQHTV